MTRFKVFLSCSQTRSCCIYRTASSLCSAAACRIWQKKSFPVGLDLHMSSCTILQSEQVPFACSWNRARVSPKFALALPYPCPSHRRPFFKRSIVTRVPQVLAVQQRPDRASGIARVEGQTAAASTIMALGAGSTLPGVLDASNRGNDLGLVVAGGGPKLTHAQLIEQIEAVGAQLRSFGVKPGQLVTLAFPNTIEVSSGWHQLVCRVLC
jgi:hypothetical protein